MKKVRILCLIMAVVFVLPIIASCGGGQKVEANVTVIFRTPKDETKTAKEISAMLKDGAKEEEVYETLLEFETKVEGTTEELPTVLKAAEQVLTHFEKDYVLSKDGTYIAEVFDRKEADSVDSENGYYSYWECTINGEASKDGRQSVTSVYDQDVIVFTWTSSSEARQDTAAIETTDPAEDETSDIPTDDTTIADEAEDNNA